MSIIEYGRGGYRPNHPSKGRVYEADDTTETVTRWNDAGTPVEQRPYTAAEKADKAARAAGAARQANGRTIEERIDAALAKSSEIRGFLDVQSPNNAQVAAQARRLTRLVLALAKLARDDLADADGTG